MADKTDIASLPFEKALAELEGIVTQGRPRTVDRHL